MYVYLPRHEPDNLNSRPKSSKFFHHSVVRCEQFLSFFFWRTLLFVKKKINKSLFATETKLEGRTSPQQFIVGVGVLGPPLYLQAGNVPPANFRGLMFYVTMMNDSMGLTVLSPQFYPSWSLFFFFVFGVKLQKNTKTFVIYVTHFPKIGITPLLYHLEVWL